MTRENPSRAGRFQSAQEKASEVKSECEELRDELQNWLDNLPENLQHGSKAETLNDAISELDDVINNLESVEDTIVEFPSMFG